MSSRHPGEEHPARQEEDADENAPVRVSQQAPPVWRERISGVDLVITLVIWAVLSLLVISVVLGPAPEDGVRQLVADVGSQVSLLAGMLLALALPATASNAASVGLSKAPRGGGGASWTRWLSAGGAAGLAVALVYAAYLLVTHLTGEAPPIPEPQAPEYTERMGTAQTAASAPILLVLTPLVEELFFRGFVYSYLRRRRLAVALVGSSLLFGASHGPSMLFFPALGLGILSALLFERSGSIWPSVAAHSAYNVCISVLLALLLPS